MSVDKGSAFRVSFVTGGPELRIAPVSKILALVQLGPVWDVASIAPVDDPFPRLHIEWHPGNGFVIQCYEDSWRSLSSCSGESSMLILIVVNVPDLTASNP